MGSRSEFFAHSARSRENWEPLCDHLRAVADRAALFAAEFGGGEEARLAGLLHDLGKYSERFTRRLEGKEARLDHWSAGAWVCLTHYRERGVAAALAIQGHHVGLQSLGALQDLGRHGLPGYGQRHPLSLTLTEPSHRLLLERMARDGLLLPELNNTCFEAQKTMPAAGMLDARMVFSALVDADFVETEAHFKGEGTGGKRYRSQGPALEAERALNRLLEHVRSLAATSSAAQEVLSVREDLLKASLAAGASKPGLFSLSAPTGSGKTLAMLAFALKHARTHGLKRVIVVIPYLTIIEQTARVYRDVLSPVFGDHYLVENHSLSEPPGDDESSNEPSGRLNRLLAENWDAPLVVTTNVQLLESLFSNRPGACRKLHRLASSVILLDEVQTLPARLAVPTLGALSHLSARYGSSVVFCTATQPAFDSLDPQVIKISGSGWKPREIVARELELFSRVRRTVVEWDVDSPIPWEDLANEMLRENRCLCVVNLKRHAVALARTLLDKGVAGVFHLSTNMCPAHRTAVLWEVKDRLSNLRGAPCLLVSTQCVEAGVDLDFPVVFRALGPLEAVAQAAGRCNRAGRLPTRGCVRVFRPEDEGYPSEVYHQAAKATEVLLQDRGGKLDIDSPSLFRDYYRIFWDLSKALDASQGKQRELDEAIRRFDWAAVALHYRLIDDSTISVAVSYRPDRFNHLRAQLDIQGRITRDWIRKARPDALNLYRPHPANSIWAYLQPVPVGKGEVSNDWFMHLREQDYDRELLGLTAAEDVWIA